MPDLFYGIGAYARERGNLPELPVVNMVVEQSPAAEKGIVLQSRPGLVSLDSIGTGPIAGMFQKNGAFMGARFAISGASLFRGSVSLGSISGLGPVSMSASPAKLLITRGQSLNIYNGSTLTTDAFPDGAQVVAVGYLAGYEIAIKKGTNTVYFRQYTASTFDGLDYFNAENEPDELFDLLIIDDQIVFLGAESVEFWPKTGDAAAPFAPVSGRVFEKGVIGTGCAARFDNTFAWIGNTGIVYIAANSPQRISDNGIEERIEKSTSYAMFAYYYEGVEYLVLRLSQECWIFSAASRQWSEFASLGHPNWRISSVAQGPVFGDDTTGDLWEFGNGHIDAGGPLERRFRAAIPMGGGTLIVDNVRLTVNVGETPNLTGDYAEPVVEMRTSRDAGRTFGAFRSKSLGRQGEYRNRVEWRACGMFDDPGMIAEFRTTDPVGLRISAVKANEPTGGRSR